MSETTETYLGQIWHDGEWLDYARSTRAQAKGWWKIDRANRRVVDWIYKENIIFPALPALTRPAEFDHEKACLAWAVSTSMTEDLNADSMTDFDFRIALQNNAFLAAADEALATGNQECLCLKPWRAFEFWNIVDNAGYTNLADIVPTAKKYLSYAEFIEFAQEVYVGSGEVVKADLIPNDDRSGYLPVTI